MGTTVTAPVDDKKMWRKLMFLSHPDTGGDCEMFVWVRNLQEHVCSQSSSTDEVEQKYYT